MEEPVAVAVRKPPPRRQAAYAVAAGIAIAIVVASWAMITTRTVSQQAVRLKAEAAAVGEAKRRMIDETAAPRREAADLVAELIRQDLTPTR